VSVFQFKRVLPLQSLCSNHKYRSTNKCRPSTVTTARQFQFKPIFQPQLSALYSHHPPTTSIGPLQSLPSNHNLSVVDNNYRFFLIRVLLNRVCWQPSSVEENRNAKWYVPFLLLIHIRTKLFTSLNVFVSQMLSHNIIPFALSTGVFNH